MRLSKTWLASSLVPLLILIYLLLIGIIAGPFAGNSRNFLLVIATIILYIQFEKLRPNKHFVFFIIAFICAKIWQIVSGELDVKRYSNAALSVSFIFAMYKYIDFKQLKSILFLWMVFNSIVMALQIMGVSVTHSWNTLIADEVRTSTEFLFNNITSSKFLSHHTARPPGLFYSQAINSAFIIGLCVNFMHHRSIVIWMLCVISVLLCGSKSTIVVLIAILFWFLFQILWNKHGQTVFKFVSSVIIITLFFYYFPEAAKKYSVWSFVFSVLIRIGSIEMLSPSISLDAARSVGGTSILERVDIWNTGIEVIILSFLFFTLFIFLPRFRKPIIKYLRMFSSIILVSLVTPISGSLLSYILIRRAK